MTIEQKIQDYADRNLSSSGFAVLDASIAFRLDAGRWATLTGCGFDFSSIYSPALPAFAESRGARIFVCDVEGIERPVRVLTRSDHQLDQRILHATGLKVANLRPWTPEVAAPAEAPKPAAPKVDEPPAHFCLARTRWFEARGIPDPKLERAPEQRPIVMDSGMYCGRRVQKERF